MDLGFAAKVLGPGRVGLRVEDARRHFNNPNLGRSLEFANIALDWVIEREIRFWRLPSHMAPYGSHPTFTQFRGQPRKYARELEYFGARLRQASIRVTKHPGQYTVLSSPRPDVVDNSIRDIDLQAELMDYMQLPTDTSVLVLHLGGKYGEPIVALERFARSYKRLSQSARDRLIVENDDRVWESREVLDFSERLGLRVVFDFHHHRCYNPTQLPMDEALCRALETWGDTRPKVHLSTGKAHPLDRSHADVINQEDWQEAAMMLEKTGKDVDVMLEAKDKDWAVLSLAQKIDQEGWFRPKLLTHLPRYT